LNTTSHSVVDRSLDSMYLLLLDHSFFFHAMPCHAVPLPASFSIQIISRVLKCSSIQ
ncbi:hypothetical protein COCCADRAFT_93867, partial [Bipolaris zeicola 26-R-13]